MAGGKRRGAKTGLVRLSSKGRFTLPSSIRKRIGLKQRDYLKAYTVGDKLVLLEKVPVSRFEQIVERFSRIAAEKSLDEKKLAALIKKVRRELYPLLEASLLRNR